MDRCSVFFLQIQVFVAFKNNVKSKGRLGEGGMRSWGIEMSFRKSNKAVRFKV